MKDDELKVSRDIYAQFINPNSDLFLETSTENIFQAAKRETLIYIRSRVTKLRPSNWTWNLQAAILPRELLETANLVTWTISRISVSALDQ